MSLWEAERDFSQICYSQPQLPAHTAAAGDNLSMAGRVALQVAARAEADETLSSRKGTLSAADGTGYISRRKQESGGESSVMAQILEQQGNYRAQLSAPKYVHASPPDDHNSDSADTLIGDQAMCQPDRRSAPCIPEYIQSAPSAHETALAVLEHRVHTEYKNECAHLPWELFSLLCVVWLYVSVS